MIEIPGLGPLLPGKEAKEKIGEDESDNKDENFQIKRKKSAKIIQPSKPRIIAFEEFLKTSNNNILLKQMRVKIIELEKRKRK